MRNESVLAFLLNKTEKKQLLREGTRLALILEKSHNGKKKNRWSNFQEREKVKITCKQREDLGR